VIILTPTKVICKRCHRELKDEESRERGYGLICWRKVKRSKNKPLFKIPAKENNKDGQSK
jgi:hypothetical protein